MLFRRKRITQRSVFVLFGLSISPFACAEGLPAMHAGAMDRPFQQQMTRSMAGMDRNMTGATMTGNPDHDFAAMMIPHHQGAIDMAKAELFYGKNPVLRRLAQEIIVTQQQEVQVMEQELIKRQ